MTPPAAGSSGSMAGLRTPLEDRADVDPLLVLHEKRRDLLVELAPLKAMHGNFGLYDAKRKALVEAMKVRARMRLQANGGKVTDAIIDAEAHCDEQYTRWLDEQMADKVRFIQLESELDAIAELIRNRELSLQVFNSEVKLAR